LGIGIGAGSGIGGTGLIVMSAAASMVASMVAVVGVGVGGGGISHDGRTDGRMIMSNIQTPHPTDPTDPTDPSSRFFPFPLLLVRLLFYEAEPDSDDANVSLTRSRFNLPNRSKVFLYGCPK
jgi:hypothetical protein